MGMILLIRKRTLLYTWLAVCMIGLSAIFLAGSRRAFTPTGAMGQGSSAQTVVIDPGHGGQDGRRRRRRRYGGKPDQSGDFPAAGTALALCRCSDGADPAGGHHGLRSRTGNHAAAEGVGPPQPGVICQRRSQRGAVEHPPEQPAVLAGDPRGADLLEPAGGGRSTGPGLCKPG